ncbi:hypothetical protein CAC42_106 [Sphaceloma murrayae]|uniref:M protein repeat protein n=1 Tax=Sphaceloma murrayae TaxID=2082308 RepID=A0A2K1QN03_9PEZI|nr:hypothetical protein CAC42_106 [Sphaceloma murrayae]
MADADDKEKAEKLAAAKKRFEELKKKQQKGKKGGTKKKEEKPDDVSEKTGDAAGTKDAADDDSKPDDAEDESKPATDISKENGDKPEVSRTPSMSLQSRQRSESFRKGSTTTTAGLKSPGLNTVDAEGEVQELYRKQAARIEELEKQVEALGSLEGQLKKAEDELEQLREGSGEVAALKSKANLADERATELEKLKIELSSTQRQLTQAQQSASNRRKSSAGIPSDLTAQLASKTSTIESLELELSNLKYQVSIHESDKSTQEMNARNLEQRATAAEEKSTSLQSEVERLKETLNAPPPDTKNTDADTDPESLQRKISVLESSLRTAQANADAATNRSTNLETKIETLTKLHRESATQNATREKEVKDLKSRIKVLTQARTDAAGEDLSDLEEEEREKLNSRIRDLEAENFELRRGVWRDKRAALQPGMDEGTGNVSPLYEDVDLNGSGSNPYGGRGSFGAGVRQSSTFSDVLQSGISAFTGRESRGPRRGSDVKGQRKQSLSLLSEDGFDEDAFRMAQEEEAMARIERIREVKRGLELWRGWRLDLAEQRQAGLPGLVTGPVFEV